MYSERGGGGESGGDGGGEGVKQVACMFHDYYCAWQFLTSCSLVGAGGLSSVLGMEGFLASCRSHGRMVGCMPGQSAYCYA